MTLTLDNIEGKQLDLCRGNIIFCHVDFFCLQGKRKMKREVFSVPYTEVIASAMRKVDNFDSPDKCKPFLSFRIKTCPFMF